MSSKPMSIMAEQRLDFLFASAVHDALTLGLGDELGARVIHINKKSSIPRYLDLSIANTLINEVKILAQPGPPSPTNYHFHIQFINNQCFSSTHAPTLTTPKWLMSTESDGGFLTDIYLLSTEAINLTARSS